MPHIIFVCSRFIIGGTEKYILNKAEWLTKNKGYEVSIISTGGDYVSQIPNYINHFIVSGIDEPPFLHTKANRRKINEQINNILKSVKPDIVETFEVYPVYYVFKSVKNIPVILNILTEVGFRKNPIFRMLTHYYSRKNQLFYLTYSSAEIINESFFLKIKKFKVIPIPLDINPVLMLEHKNYVLSVARMSYDKMYVKALIKDFSKYIEKKSSNLNLVLVGNGPLFSEVEKAIKLQSKFCQSRIQLLGNKYDDELQDLFKNCKVFVGMGTSLLNAAAYGKISIIATNNIILQDNGIGIFGDNTENDSFGQINKYSQIHSFEHYFDEIDKRENSLDEIRYRSIRIIEQKYNKELVNKKWDEEYQVTKKTIGRSGLISQFMHSIIELVISIVLNAHLFWRKIKY